MAQDREREEYSEEDLARLFKTGGFSQGCPRCGCPEFRTVTSRLLSDGTRRRRRVCAHCGVEVFTSEVPLSLGRVPPMPEDGDEADSA